MMEYFDMKGQVNGYIGEIETHPADELENMIDSDPEKGLERMANLLTFLPEEQRKAAVKGFVMAMLCD